MIKLTVLSVSLLLAGCSSSPFKEQTLKNEKVVKHLQQGKQYIDGGFDSRFNNSGNDGMNLRAIGKAIYPIETNELLVRASAISASKFKLTESAPTEFKSLVQQAIGNSLGFNGEFTKIETSITEVHGLRGIEVKEENVQCRTVVEPTSEGDYKNLKECRSIATVPLSELNKAFNFTMDQKYGPQQKSSVEKLLEEQLKANTVNSGSRAISSNH